MITIKTKKEIEILRRAGKILSLIMNELKCSLKTGITTKEIDDKAQALMASNGVVPAFKGYRGFPAAVCVSINEQIVHGIPGDRVIGDGDIVSLDAGIIYENYFSDTAFTVIVGESAPDREKLLEVAEESLYKGIAQARVGNHLSDISHEIQKHIETNHFSVVRDFVGHGIGKALHEEPEIPNFGPPKCGPVLEEGMVLAIEPMANIGTWKTKILKDGWTVVTEDHKSSAHFEHTIAVIRSGPQILTK